MAGAGMRMTGFVLAAVVIIFTFFVAGCADRVETPGLAREGATGPLALRFEPGVSAPEYHAPPEYWQARHGDILLGTGDFSIKECLVCHVAEASCDNCHRYVGAPLVAPE